MPELKLSESPLAVGLTIDDNWSPVWVERLNALYPTGGRLKMDVSNNPKDAMDVRDDHNTVIDVIGQPDALMIVQPTSNAQGLFSIGGSVESSWTKINCIGRDVDAPAKLTADVQCIWGIASMNTSIFEDIKIAGVISSQAHFYNILGNNVRLKNIRSGGGGGRLFQSDHNHNIILDDLRVFDYFQVFDQFRYFDRNSYTDYWVYITDALQDTEAHRKGCVELNNFFGDEDGETQVYIEKQGHVYGRQNGFNCIGTGIWCKDVNNVELHQTHPGYNGHSRGARFTNCKDVFMNGYNWDAASGDPADYKYIQIDDINTNFVGQNVRGKVVAPQALLYTLNGRKCRGGIVV